jgi:hypothetical protein
MAGTRSANKPAKAAAKKPAKAASKDEDKRSYVCERQCGFQGLFDAVKSHEKGCKAKRPTTAAAKKQRTSKMGKIVKIAPIPVGKAHLGLLGGQRMAQTDTNAWPQASALLTGRPPPPPRSEAESLISARGLTQGCATATASRARRSRRRSAWR